MAKVRERRSVKRTYTISAEISDRFETLVPAGQRSQVVETLLVRELEVIRRQRLKDEVKAGLVDMKEVNIETLGDWESTEGDGWPSS